ncbi:MAG: hypothetical protein M1561_04235 [Gammaproteobacteria bacterium]|nr:hypothetical protein [Gammaproteobacteria bacterium]
MGAQFSYKNFLRHVPNELLEKYFSSKNINLGIYFKKLKKDRESIIFQTITKLPQKQQSIVEMEFQDINAMACEGAHYFGG